METLNLTYGSHASPEEGMCLMEAVAFLGGEEHSDRPECSCPVIAAYGRALNDRMGKGAGGDALRAKYLAPLASRLVGTRSTPEVEQKRMFFIADRAVRVFAPMALESAGVESEAERLRGLTEIMDENTACAAEAAAADTAYARAPRAADSAADSAWAAADSAARAAEAAAPRAAEAAAEAAFWAAWAAYDAADAWEQAAKVLSEACEITNGGEA